MPSKSLTSPIPREQQQLLDEDQTFVKNVHLTMYSGKGNENHKCEEKENKWLERHDIRGKNKRIIQTSDTCSIQKFIKQIAISCIMFRHHQTIDNRNI